MALPRLLFPLVPSPPFPFSSFPSLPSSFPLLPQFPFPLLCLPIPFFILLSFPFLKKESATLNPLHIARRVQELKKITDEYCN